MKPIHSPHLCLSKSQLLATTAIGCLFAISPIGAQQNPGTPQNPNYAPPAQYNSGRPGYGEQRPKASQRVGNFVRNLFYGELGSKGTPANSSSTGSRSLDGPPASAYRPTPDAPPSGSSSMANKGTATPTVKKTPPAVTPKPAVKKPVSQYVPPKIQNTPPVPKPPQPSQQAEEIPPVVEPTVKNPSPPVEDQAPPVTPSDVDSSPGVADVPQKQDASSAPKTTAGETVAKTEEPKSTTPSSDNTQFLVGKKTAVPGRVISPYPPHQELDITGLSSGSLALDPTTNKVFQIP